MRTADRYRPGETPVASLKVREKWKRLSMALCAISWSERGSLYRFQMQWIARSIALFIKFLPEGQRTCRHGSTDRAVLRPARFRLRTPRASVASVHYHAR